MVESELFQTPGAERCALYVSRSLISVECYPGAERHVELDLMLTYIRAPQLRGLALLTDGRE
jgi:hypothetical protein